MAKGSNESLFLETLLCALLTLLLDAFIVAVDAGLEDAGVVETDDPVEARRVVEVAVVDISAPSSPPYRPLDK